MAITIVTTPKAVNANAYCTLAEAEKYWEEHLYADIWNSTSDALKNAAIVQAARVLDTLDWDGFKTTLEQAMRWPRSGLYDPDGDYLNDDLLPNALKYANAEMAGVLLQEDRTADQGTSSYESVRVGSIGVTYNKTAERRLVPRSVNDHIKWYLASGGGTNAVSLVRT